MQRLLTDGAVKRCVRGVLELDAVAPIKANCGMSIEIEKPVSSPVVEGHKGTSAPERCVQTAILRGARQTCPACGHGALYGHYLKVEPDCRSCGEALHHQRADDAPPYFTMLITGHVIVAGVMTLEQAYAPPFWLHTVIWGPLLLLMSLLLLPRIKGALIGLQWALRMHGFGGEDEAEDHGLATPLRADR